ncbi:MAG TPA: hypothetical protein VN635_03800 [Conexibacter sp.]|nr:hypothetical protein [Conexibacter sp.]
MDLSTPAAGDDQPTLALPTGEQCAACGAPLARDQRYCVACGERRGKPRLPFMDGRPRHAPAPAPTAPGGPARERRAGASAGATLVAGVGTLVLAMGVGVLIGRSGGSDSGGRAAAPPVQVVTVAGGGSGATDTTATTSTDSTSSRGRAKVKALPRSKLPPPTVRLGQRGSGPGFRRGRFTGDFFGP